MATRLAAYLQSHTGRLLLGSVFVHALLLPFLFVGLLHLETTGRESQFVNDVRSQAYLLATLLEQNPERLRLARLTDELVLSGQVVYADYQAPTGELIASGFNSRDSSFQEDFFFGEHGDHIYYIAVPSRGKNGGTLRVGFSELPLEERLNSARRIVLLMVGGYLVLTAVMIVFYGRLLQRSIRLLQHASRRIASGDVEERMTVDTGIQEISSLAADLERMRQILQRREQDIAQREARQRAVLETAAEGIVTLDADGRIETVNKAAEKIFGCSADEVVGQPFIQFLAPEALERFLTANGLPAASSCVELSGHRRSGEKCELMLSVSETLVGGARCFTIFVQDISERIAYEARLAHLATHDSLTGLPNRALFTDRLKQVLAHADRGEHIVAILFLDLDRFKEINDNLGHHIGDRVLQAAARRLKGCLRTEDTLARLGGDEFTLILPQLERPTSAAIVAENIVQAMERPFLAGDCELSISCSIGIATFPFDGKDADELARNADAAMYAAKRAGGCGFQFFSKPINAEANDRIELDASLRSALERGELVLHYEPQIDAQSLKVAGVEALAYWQHPERGLLSPAQFIPLAERSGVIAALGKWALTTACRQGKAWHDAGWPVRVGVRLSGSHFRQAEIFQDIREALTASGLPPGALTLELDAGMIAECGDETKAVLQHLKQLGILLALDGFGTGYSSFSCLKRFPIDVIRIDRSFIHEIGGRDKEGILAAAIIAMARGLHIKAVAEGVETIEQLAYLQAKGCDTFQGAYFSPPLPAEDVTGLLRRSFEPTTAAADWKDVA